MLASFTVFELAPSQSIVHPEPGHSSLSMASLSNYLRTNRRRLSLSQEDVGFLIGVNGDGKGIKVSRNENNSRPPDLRTALAYQAIYGKSVHELFAGLYEEVEQEMITRANVLRHRTTGKSNSKRQETVTNLISKLTG